MSFSQKRKKEIRLRHLESWLEDVDVFERPKLKLEQYPTTSHLAACMLHTAHTRYDDVEEKTVADLGVGCGILGIGCCMLDTSFVLGIDIDEDALSTCSSNLQHFEITNMDLMQCDVQTLAKFPGHLHQAFDTVVMNPPFGTKKNEGIDMMFLQAGLNLAQSAVYSLHKTATRQHILKKAADWGVDAEVLAELSFNIDNTYKFHTQRTVDIEVDFFRFSHKVEKHKS